VTGVKPNVSFKLSDKLKKREAMPVNTAEKRAVEKNIEPGAKKTKAPARKTVFEYMINR